jgi:hypothetical protein
MKHVNIKPLKPGKAVEHSRYDGRILDAAAHFLTSVPPGFDGRKLLSVLSYGSKEDIASVGVRLWDNVPDARDAANRIDALARHMLAVEDYNVHAAAEKDKSPASVPLPKKAKPCPLVAAMTAAGLPIPPEEVLAAIREVAGIRPDSKVEVVSDDLPGVKGNDAPELPHGIPPAMHEALQKTMPGIVVANGKVVSCPGIPVALAQHVLDDVLDVGRKLGLN